jgi:hypothetical protein
MIVKVSVEHSEVFFLQPSIFSLEGVSEYTQASTIIGWPRLVHVSIFLSFAILLQFFCNSLNPKRNPLRRRRGNSVRASRELGAFRETLGLSCTPAFEEIQLSEETQSQSFESAPLNERKQSPHSSLLVDTSN